MRKRLREGGTVAKVWMQYLSISLSCAMPSVRRPMAVTRSTRWAAQVQRKDISANHSRCAEEHEMRPSRGRNTHYRTSRPNGAIPDWRRRSAEADSGVLRQIVEFPFRSSPEKGSEKAPRGTLNLASARSRGGGWCKRFAVGRDKSAPYILHSGDVASVMIAFGAKQARSRLPGRVYRFTPLC